MKWLYVGEVGYGNLGDDACAELITDLIREPIQVRALDGLTAEDRADRLIIGGGTILSLRSTTWMKNLANVSERSGRVATVGTGVDPGIPWDMEGIALARRIFATIDPPNRGLRGPMSVAALAAVGIDETVIAGDPFCLYQPIGAIKDSIVGIIPGHQGRSVGGPHFHDRMIQAIKGIPGKVIYIPVWARDLGLERAYQTFSGRGDCRYVGPQLHLIAGLLAKCRAVIANRMHAGLLALICGTPAFFVAHHIKVTDLCLALDWPHWAPADDDDLVGKVGRFCLDWHRHTMPERQINGFASAIQGIVDRLR